MTYRPNFTDPRVRARCLKAIGFISGVMSETKAQEWSSRYIDKYLGNQRNDLSKYLRENLLICVDDFYRYNSSENHCKKYLLNKIGLRDLREALKITNIQTYPSVVEVVKQDHFSELSTGKFEYTDKSNRLWHPLQRYRKQYKQQILADHGYQHQYDIECCAPTLIHQHSQRIPEVIVNGRWQQGPMDIWLFALRKYLDDKQSVRQQIAQDLDLPIEAVKEVINALFAGAVISRNKESDIFHILNGDLARIQWLKEDPFVQELVSDIKTCWEYIRPSIPLRTKKTSKGTERRLPVNSKQKWLVYFELERQVLSSVRDYLDQRSVRYFLEHDGWTCSEEIDRDELREYIKQRTGFALRFDYKKITNIQTYPSVVEVANQKEKYETTNA